MRHPPPTTTRHSQRTHSKILFSYVWLDDDQHGVKQPDATAFPNGNSLGASWSPELLTRVGMAIGTEARGVFNSLLDKSAEEGGEGWPGTLKNGATLTA
jgi:beta-glucosidase-like glycosyl hydrolase